MNTQSLTTKLPDSLYRSAVQIADATNRPLAEVVENSLAHSLPPLDDLTPEEAAETQLQQLVDEYGRLLKNRMHGCCWRGCRVPPQIQIAS